MNEQIKPQFSQETDQVEATVLEFLDRMSNFVCLVKNGLIRHVNTPGLRLLDSRTASRLVGRPFSNFVHPDFGEIMSLGLELFAEEEVGVPIKLVQANGSTIDVNLKVSILNDWDGGEFLFECQDITKFVRASETARNRERQFRDIINAFGKAIVMTKSDGTIYDFNHAAETMFGFDRKEVVGNNVSILMSEPHRSKHDTYLKNYSITGKSALLGTVREFVGQKKNGTIFPIELAVSEVVIDNNRKNYIGVIQDITVRKAKEDLIKHLAHHDELTGLPNRNLFNSRLERAIERAQRGKTKVGLLFVDLDKFKPVNDNLGHAAGDIVLKTIAERLNNRLRKTDTVARVGGDEFVIIMEALHSKENAESFASDIINSLNEPVIIDLSGQSCVVGASIGIGIFPDDAAMYKAKETGRNRFRFYQK